MPKFVLAGRVVPEYYQVTIVSKFKVEHRIDELGIQMSFEVKVDNSLLSVDCETSTFPDHLGMYWSHARDFSRSAVQLPGFHLGQHLDIIFDHIIDPSGTRRPFIRDNPIVKGVCQSFDTTTFNDALQALFSEPNLLLALSELNLAMDETNQCVGACYRAIERIRNALAPHRHDDKKARAAAWKNLREALNVSERFIGFVADEAKQFRHGHLGILRPATRDEVLRRAWIIMDRSIAYKCRGSSPLPASEFPLL